MSFRLLPKDVQFFDLFVADGENLEAAATRLHRMVTEYTDLDRHVEEIQRLEKVGDDIDREITQRLEDAFVTPVRPGGHPRADGPPRRRRRRHPGGRRDVRDLRHRPADRRGPRADPHPRRPGRRAARGAAQARRAEGPRVPPRARSTTSSTRPTRCRGPPSGACSASRPTPSRSSSGATSTASSRTPSTPPRMPPRPSSGCTTRRRSRPASAPGGSVERAVQEVGPGRGQRLGVGQLQPAQRVGDLQRRDRRPAARVGCAVDRPPAGLAPVRRGSATRLRERRAAARGWPRPRSRNTTSVQARSVGAPR